MSAEVVLLFLLVIKHSFADLFLQTFNKNIDKTKYLGNGQKHYLQHSFLTLLITLNFICNQKKLNILTLNGPQIIL